MIEHSLKYCDDCLEKYEREKKDRYKQYDEDRKDDMYWKFYKTKEWIRLREYALMYYNYIDLWEYYMNNRIINANTSHHIIELRENWDRRLDFTNQFPCSESNHNVIHGLYEKDKKGTQEMLRELLDRWEIEFGGN